MCVCVYTRTHTLTPAHPHKATNLVSNFIKEELYKTNFTAQTFEFEAKVLRRVCVKKREEFTRQWEALCNTSVVSSICNVRFVYSKASD